MIERSHPTLSVGAQCRLLSISRSSYYYAPLGETEMNLTLMRLIDRQFLETPFYGVQQMTWHLQNEGHAVNVKRIRRLRAFRITKASVKIAGSRGRVSPRKGIGCSSRSSRPPGPTCGAKGRSACSNSTA